MAADRFDFIVIGGGSAGLCRGDAAGARPRRARAADRARAAAAAAAAADAGRLHEISRARRLPGDASVGAAAHSSTAARRSCRRRNCSAAAVRSTPWSTCAASAEDYDGWDAFTGRRRRAGRIADMLPHFRAHGAQHQAQRRIPRHRGTAVRSPTRARSIRWPRRYMLAIQGLGVPLQPRFQRRAAERRGADAAHHRRASPLPRGGAVPVPGGARPDA